MRINRDPPLADSVSQNLKRTFIFNSGIRPLGLLRSCKEYALNDKTRIDGVSTQENPGSYPPSRSSENTTGKCLPVSFAGDGVRRMHGSIEA